MIEIEQATHATDELVKAFNDLMPQLTQYNPPPTRQELEAMLSSSCSLLYVAREPHNRQIVGALTLVVFRTPTGQHAWIEDVIVDEAQRGQGIGEALTHTALEKAASMGVKSVNLTSRPTREAANRLYQRIGFQRWETNLYHYTVESNTPKT